MPVDFSDLLDEDDEVLLHPRDIFSTLNRSSNFSFPRDIQTEVMNRWFAARDANDNVIKLNVGSGKTLVGLLLPLSCAMLRGSLQSPVARLPLKVMLSHGFP